MNVIGELHAHRPFLAQAVLDLRGDLRVGQFGQKGESALGHVHVDLSWGLAVMSQTATAVGVKSEVSVEV